VHDSSLKWQSCHSLLIIVQSSWWRKLTELKAKLLVEICMKGFGMKTLCVK